MDRLHKTILFFFLSCLFVFNSGSGFTYSKTIKFTIYKKNKQNYISLYDLTQKTEIENIFSVITGRGKLYYKTHSVTYQCGLSVIIIDGLIAKDNNSIIRDNGEILVPISLFTQIMATFYPHYIPDKKSHYLFLTLKKPLPKPGINNVVSKKPAVIKSEKNQKNKITFVIIDPGHGGKDPGALGRKSREKNITLQVAIKLKKYLQKKIGRKVKTRMTRYKDRFISLGRRTEIANRYLNKNNNGLFISIHANASLSSRISGYETYFLSQNPSNASARSTAALENNVIILENKSSKKKYKDFEYIEAIMLTTQIQKESRLLAYSIQKSLKATLASKKSRGVKKADFFVLRGSLLPSVLIEIGYITNRYDLKNLKSQKYQKKLSNAIGKGILYFIGKYNKIIK